jgi:starch synthase/alpha-amylase
MVNFLTLPRILFVTSEMAFMPEGNGSRTNFIRVDTDGIGGLQAELISDLIELGADVHVAQPDFRKIFAICCRKEKVGASVKLPSDRVHLAEDKAIFYSKPINSNSIWENIKISLAFQREVINQIVPRVQPDLIHCCDWMTGLIPAAARQFEIPSLFTAHKFDTARSFLSYVEDRGIDAASFWQHLYYERYPASYEETRGTNPADFLLSGVLAAHFVTSSRSAFLANGGQDQNRFAKFPIWEVLAKKIDCGCAMVTQHRAKMQQYIELYEKLLQHAICRPLSENINIPADRTPQSVYNLWP